MAKKHSFGKYLLDFLLIVFTGGLWGIWMLVRFLRDNI